MTTGKNAKGLNITLWVLQVLLGLMYLMAGGNKLFQPIDALAKMLPWVTQVPRGLVRFIGLSELLGGIGLLLPSIIRIKPGLTPLAAIGLALVQVFALFFHISKGEGSVVIINIVFMGIALFIAWGRARKVPIQPKAA